MPDLTHLAELREREREAKGAYEFAVNNDVAGVWTKRLDDLWRAYEAARAATDVEFRRVRG